MATRIYVRSEGTPDITPSSWNFAVQINPVSLPGTLVKNSGSAMTSKTEATGTTNPTARAMGRTIIGPLKAQTINGSVKGQMRGSESNAGANATLAMAVKVIKPDGTDRGVLLAQTASDSATAGNELVISLTNAQFKDAAENASITLSSVAVSDGDYLVIEWGFRSATSISRNITLSYGNDNATDLPEDTSTTAANNPWFEFTTTISFIRETVGASAGLAASSVVGAATASSTASASGTTGGSAVAAAFTSAVGSSSGVAASDGLSAAIWGAVGDSAGLSTTDGLGASTAAGTAQSEGVSSVSGVLTADALGVASADGSANVDGIAVGFAIGEGLSAGVSTSSFVLEATSIGTGQSTGESQVSGVFVSFAESLGEATGIAVTNYLAAAFAQTQAQAAGAASESFIGSEIHWANGSSIGVSIVDGVAGAEGSVGLSVGMAAVSGSGAAIISVVAASLSVAVVTGNAARLLSPVDLVDISTEPRIFNVYNEGRIVLIKELEASVVSAERRIFIASAEQRTA
jgi:hypothetical protein